MRPDHYEELPDWVVEHSSKSNKRWRRAQDFIANVMEPWTSANMKGMGPDGYPLVELVQMFSASIVNWSPKDFTLVGCNFAVAGRITDLKCGG